MTTATPSLNTQRSTARLSDPATQLKAASIITIGFALMIAFGAHEATDGPLRWFADLLFWPLGDAASVLTDESQLLAAILGGVMTGWGLTLYMLTDALADDHPALLKRIVVTAMIVWFVVDSAGSIASGGWLNVIGNIGFGALFAIPAMRLR